MAGQEQAGKAVARYAPSRRIFGILFLISTPIWVLLLLSTGLLVTRNSFAPPPTNIPSITAGVPSPTSGPGSPLPPPSTGSSLDAGAIAIAGSCLTSIVSLLGFGFTTLMGLRRDRRDAQTAELDRKIRELELERQRLELEERKRDMRRDDQPGKEE